MSTAALRHYLDHGILAALLFLAGVTFHRCHAYHHDHPNEG